MPSLIIVCIFPLLFLLQVLGADLRGVAPENLDLYKSKTKFKCADASNEFPISFVNDDYCDCQDGSDEPGTAACSNGEFSCPNAGWRRRTIISSRVNDGICDCCDGSDEYSSGIKCPHSCEQFKLEATKHIRTAIEEIKVGLEEKSRMIAKAEDIRNEKVAAIEKLKIEIEEQNQKVEQKKKEKEEKEEREKEERERRREEHERRQKEKEIAERLERGESLEDESEDGETAEGETDADPQEVDSRPPRTLGEDDKGETVQEIDVHPDGSADEHASDDEKKKDFPYPEEYAYHEGEGEKEASDDSLSESDDSSESEGEEKEDFPYPEEYAFRQEVQDELDEDDVDYAVDEDDDDDLYYYEEEEEYFDDDYDLTDDDIDEEEDIDYEKWYNYKDDEATTARDEYNNENRKKTELEQELEKAEKFMELDFGPDLEYVALYGKCFSKKVSKYDYEFCGFEQAHQKEGGSKTDLGKFDGWKENESKRIMQFRNGQKCWQGPNRSLDVEFKCGPINEMISMNEPSKCVYEAQFKTPAACSQEDFEKLKIEFEEISHQKDEL